MSVKGILKKVMSFTSSSQPLKLSRRMVITTSDQVTKPPNVLVQTSPDHNIHVNIVQLLEQSLKRDKYVVYPVSRELLETITAWADNTKLLVIFN